MFDVENNQLNLSVNERTFQRWISETCNSARKELSLDDEQILTGLFIQSGKRVQFIRLRNNE